MYFTNNNKLERDNRKIISKNLNQNFLPLGYTLIYKEKFFFRQSVESMNLREPKNIKLPTIK